MDFHFAIDVVTDLAAILLECSVSGSVNLHDLDEYNTPSRRIRITATPEEHDAMNKALADFVHAPLEYDLSEMMGEDEITDMAYQVEMLRKELYEASGCNRTFVSGIGKRVDAKLDAVFHGGLGDGTSGASMSVNYFDKLNLENVN